MLAKVESDPGFKERALAMMEVFHKAEREQRAVTIIEECLTGKLPVPRVVERESRRLNEVRRLLWFSQQRGTTRYEFSEHPGELLTREADLSRKAGA
jgi:hypothetical protein